MLSVTAAAPRVSQCSAMLVGALHCTGTGGPISEMMRGPPSADTVVVVGGTELRGTVVDADVEVEIEVVELALDVVVEAREGRFESSLLLQAAGTTNAAIITRQANRGRRTRRS
jgi:hypothetical protein